jgi:non-specific serine/threonine protein kinase
MVGKTIAHYKILERLGEGGMGVVYKAEDTRLKRTVALKFLPPELTRDNAAKERFTHEAQAASALDHPNICTIHEVNNTEDGQLFMAMACYEGVTLKEKIEQGPLSEDEAVSILSAVADGLSRAHEAGIVHRDIKPANIMITSRGEVKILDFGLAKLSGRTLLTKTGTTLGTAAYMSPQQAVREAVDHRTDLWSLGVVLYEMLTCNHPFRGEHEAAMVYSIVNEEPKPIREHRPEVPQELENIARRAMAKPPEERYQSADELLRDIESYREGSQLSRKTRQPVALLSGLAALVLVVLGLLWLLNGSGTESGGETRERSIAVLPFTSISRSEDEEIFTEGIHQDILTHLAKIGDIKVLARQSVMRYRDTELQPSQIGRELAVSYLLEASVRRVAENIRITVQLLDAETEEHVWVDTYDKKYASVFSIQSEIAQRVAQEIKATLTPEEKEQIQRIPTDNSEAYEYYLKGNYYWVNHGYAEWRMVTRMYLEAIKRDPSFALAFAKLSLVYSNAYNIWDDKPQIFLDSARIFLEKSEAIDPDLAEVHHARGLFLGVQGVLEGSLPALEKGLEADPNNAEIHVMIANIWLTLLDLEKATPYYERAHQLNPYGKMPAKMLFTSYKLGWRWAEAEQLLNKYVAIFPEDKWGYAAKADVYLSGYGDTERARGVLEEASQHIPESSRGIDRARWLVEIYSKNYERAPDVRWTMDGEYVWKALKYRYMGRIEDATVYFDSARIIAEKNIKRAPNTAPDYWALGYALAGLGRKDEAIYYGRYRVDNPSPVTKRYVRKFTLKHLARIYVMVGEYEKAIDELETVLSVPMDITGWDLRLDPMYNPLRDHPRFKKLVEAL